MINNGHENDVVSIWNDDV